MKTNCKKDMVTETQTDILTPGIHKEEVIRKKQYKQEQSFMNIKKKDNTHELGQKKTKTFGLNITNGVSQKVDTFKNFHKLQNV